MRRDHPNPGLRAVCVSLFIAVVALTGCAASPEPGVPTNSAIGPTSDPLPSLESLEIDGSIINDSEQIVNVAIESAIAEWLNSGSGLENARAGIEGGDPLAYASGIASRYDALYIGALLPDDWQDNSELRSWVQETMIPVHARVLAVNFATTPELNLDSANTAAYAVGERVTNVDSFTTHPDGSVTVVTTENAFDNADKNSAKNLEETPVTGEDHHVSRTFGVVDGKLKLLGVSTAL